jgi:hypothetical protein
LLNGLQPLSLIGDSMLATRVWNAPSQCAQLRNKKTHFRGGADIALETFRRPVICNNNAWAGRRTA